MERKQVDLTKRANELTFGSTPPLFCRIRNNHLPYTMTNVSEAAVIPFHSGMEKSAEISKVILE